jgi:serine/threonine-protein kinase RsbT
MAGEHRIPIVADSDLVVARQKGREVAAEVGFSSTDATLIATAISELSRNILDYSGRGEIAISRTCENGTEGVVVMALDSGPGIGDIDSAVLEGYSSANGLGMGLPGTRRLMDEFDIRSEVGKGTTVVVKKWRSRAGR